MNLELTKIRECENSVWYSVKTITTGDTYLSHSNNLRYKIETKEGTICFDKNSNNINFEINQTDNYFLSSEHFMNSIRSLILGKMKRCKKEGHFPDKTGISTG